MDCFFANTSSNSKFVNDVVQVDNLIYDSFERFNDGLMMMMMIAEVWCTFQCNISSVSYLQLLKW